MPRVKEDSKGRPFASMFLKVFNPKKLSAEELAKAYGMSGRDMEYSGVIEMAGGLYLFSTSGKVKVGRDGEGIWLTVKKMGSGKVGM